MFRKRMASITKLAKAELDAIRERQTEMSERLIGTYRGVLACPDPHADAEASQRLGLARRTVEQAGGFGAQLTRGGRGASRQQLHAAGRPPSPASRDDVRVSQVVELEAASADRSVMDTVAHALAHAHLTRDFIADRVDGIVVDLSFASEQWQRIVRDRDRPGRLNRRHFEACVFTCLAAELRTGDVAVRGSQAYAMRRPGCCPGRDCEVLLGEFCATRACRRARGRSATRCAKR